MMDNKYDAQKNEAKWVGKWAKDKLFKFDSKSKKEIFSIDTPPPYASADHLHVGHGMSYSHIEFIARYQKMRGKNVFFPMGYDDNGLPTERFVEKKHKINKSKISRKDFIKLCLEETKKTGKTYFELFSRLGFSIDWDLLYQTIGDTSRRIGQKSFIDLYNKRRVERVDLPSMWCTKCQTNLAQADLDNLEFESMFNDVVFYSENKELTISTTRPELLPACVALFYNPLDKRYAKYKGKFAKVPLFDYEVPILSDDSVDIETGTGLMMVCTYGDKEDIEKWHKYDLPLKIVFNEVGKMNEHAKDFQGLSIREARKQIIAALEEKGFLKNKKDIKHVVNVHERCQTEVEYLKKPQWQIKVLDKKQELLQMGDKINWYPEHMKTRYKHWVNNLNWDWGISRQRYYGVPFPVWYCLDCGATLLPAEKDLPVDPREESYKGKCKCGSNKIEPERDVMDTWMMSSNTPEINSHWGSKNEMKGFLPMSLRPQAHDIIRTWAFYTILKSLYHHNNIPWKDIAISGHGQDKHGHKMSKSKGNFIAAQEVIKDYSADIFRYWSGSVKLGDDLPYQEDDLKNGKKFVTKLWNASKFVYMHLEDYKNKKHDFEKLECLDKWLLIKLNKVIKNSTKAFDSYEFSKAKKEMEYFFWNYFCDNYLEIVKDRLYNPDKRGKEARVSGQFTLYKTLLNLLKLFSPVTPFITEEIHSYYFAEKEKKKFISLSKWPEEDPSMDNVKIEKIGDKFVEILSDVRKFKSDQGKSLKEEVKIVLVEKDFKLLKDCMDDFKASTQSKEVKAGKKFSVGF